VANRFDDRRELRRAPNDSSQKPSTVGRADRIAFAISPSTSDTVESGAIRSTRRRREGPRAISSRRARGSSPPFVSYSEAVAFGLLETV
jgi:hypothetical protein